MAKCNSSFLEPEGISIFNFWFSLNLIYFVLWVLRNMYLSYLISGSKKNQLTRQYHILCKRHDFISQNILTWKETYKTINLMISEVSPYCWVWRWIFQIGTAWDKVAYKNLSCFPLPSLIFCLPNHCYYD